MAIWALADLHLGFAVDKPMDIFGEVWRDHPAKIEAAWRETVAPEDTVLVAGDISWGMTLDEAMPDLEFIDRLPGRKVMIRGNHDSWWVKIGQLRKRVPASIHVLQHDATIVEGFAVCGTRGWDLPIPGYSMNVLADEKVFERERQRLRLSFEKVAPGWPIIVMLHYPPVVKGRDAVGFSDIIEEFGAHTVVYGHYHGPDKDLAFEGERNGVRYIFCAADAVGFRPVRVA